MNDLRLTRAQRLRAGCVVALLYLLCVLTPTVALALPGMATPDCLLTDGAATVHVHSHASGESQHRAMHSDHGAAPAHDMAMMNAKHEVAPGKIPTRPVHGAAGASCCELMCLTALPATLVDVTRPSVPPSRCDNEPSRVAADNAPLRLYRPPISLG